ncbi:hypothetical protein ACIO6T_30830 [Streptomyces sp. NPDC087532]|uniref:hypothetical protein n=1 Tax=Streptomyces sp. NPDC087532 TaxID=3365795 RepID=UPI0038172615
MSMGERLGAYGPHIAVAAVIASEAITTALHGSHVSFALYGAMIAGGIWAWHSHCTHDRGVWAGSMAQSMTWDSFVRPSATPEHNTAPLYLAMAERMGKTEHHVRAFAQQHSLERISIALPLSRGAFGDANSTRHGARGHLWLGQKWFHPRHTHHLPAVLEHELAHLRRHDTRKRLIAESAAVAATTLCSGLLALPALTLIVLTARLSLGAVRWWGELACDAAAVRACGRAPVAAMWSADLADERTMPWVTRTWHTMRAVRIHPPLRLRRWFALRAPLRLSADPHPLLATPARV